MTAYVTPNPKNILLKYFPGSYSPLGFKSISLDFYSRSVSSSSLNAYINVATFPPEEYDVVKKCERYIIGYARYGVQVLEGKCTYSAVRNLVSTLIPQPPYTSTSADLPGYLKVIKGRDFSDLFGGIRGFTWLDLSSFIRGVEERNLGAAIDTHLPKDILAYVKVLSRDYIELPSNIYGWQTSDLSAHTGVMSYYNLPVLISLIPGVDLPAYLKVWPSAGLISTLHGWGVNNLGVYIKSVYFYNLNAYIGTHLWSNLNATIKGLGIESESYLPANVLPMQYSLLPAYLAATYLSNLGANIFAIPYKALSASLFGWAKTDLPAFLNVISYPYNLSASLNVMHNLKDLVADIYSKRAVNISGNLQAIIGSWQEADLSSFIEAVSAGILHASITPIIYASVLNASIYPKMIRLTGIIPVSTMSHKNLYAMINMSCVYSDSSFLNAYIRTVFKSELSASIFGNVIPQFNSCLSASVGYTDKFITVDKLPINVHINSDKYITEDKLPLYTSISKGVRYLSSYIKGISFSKNLAATINSIKIKPYEFKSAKSKELIHDLDRDGKATLSKVIEITFKDTIDEYVYSSSGNIVFKPNDTLNKWLVNVKSYLPENRALNRKRLLFKSAILNDIRGFRDIDEAVRGLIHYVTDAPCSNLSASINLTMRSMSTIITAYLNPIYKKPGYENLSSSITSEYRKVVLLSDDHEEINII